jgi:hypothetical protein
MGVETLSALLALVNLVASFGQTASWRLCHSVLHGSPYCSKEAEEARPD